MSDQEIKDFDYVPAMLKTIDYKERFMDFLTRWCAKCQNREPMTHSDMAANDFAIKLQAWLNTDEWGDN